MDWFAGNPCQIERVYYLPDAACKAYAQICKCPVVGIYSRDHIRTQGGGVAASSAHE